jgi:hypothetical protein
MDDRMFDALTRRASLATLSAAGLAMLMAPFPGKAKKKRNSNDEQKAKQKCKSQVGQCVNILTTLCGADPPTCLQAQEQCCPIAGQCDFTGFLNCLILLEA